MTDKEIFDRIWQLSPSVTQQESYDELTGLTRELMELYSAQGRLDDDPFFSVRERSLDLPFDKINAELEGSVCIVTGGFGCIGSILIDELLKFKVKLIVVLDNTSGVHPNKNNPFDALERVASIPCDIRSFHMVRSIFSLYKPDFVFHVAAERDPGFAESHACHTVTTNVFGTLNIVNACECTDSVKQMIFSSTGKASRYLTKEVYAATKKICEFILSAYAIGSKVKYSVVRFTHILDNSLMNMELTKKSKNDKVLAIHSPGKYVTAQTGKEAAYLMLNALIGTEEKQCALLLVRYLSWPVESLLVALYQLKQSGRNIPLIFVGNPLGYSEKFFRGQVNWSKPTEVNLLINVFEANQASLNGVGDIIISKLGGISKTVLHHALQGMIYTRDDEKVRGALIDGLHEIFEEFLKTADQDLTRDILQWGTDPEFLEIEGIRTSDFGALVPMLTESLQGSKYYGEAAHLMYEKHNQHVIYSISNIA